MTERNFNKSSASHRHSLWRLMHIFWPSTITATSSDKQETMDTILEIFCRSWIGRIPRKTTDPIPRMAPHWTPEGKCSGREAQVEIHKDYTKWRTSAAALCAWPLWWGWVCGFCDRTAGYVEENYLLNSGQGQSETSYEQRPKAKSNRDEVLWAGSFSCRPMELWSKCELLRIHMTLPQAQSLSKSKLTGG